MSKQGKNTTSDTTAIELVRDYDKSLDNYMTDVCLFRTMGDVVKARDIATNVKQLTVNSMIFNAVFERDIDLIRTIALRIDGTVPDEEKRDRYANIFGDAIEDVLGRDIDDQMNIVPSDPPVIAMAKALVYIGTQPCGSNYARRKERNLAAQMILERCGGRKIQPAMVEATIEYVDPEWMQLPVPEEGRNDGSADVSEQTT